MKNEKEMAYYITMFKIEGHKTWRVHTAGHDSTFEKERKQWTNPPKITEKKTLRINRITGEIDIKD